MWKVQCKHNCEQFSTPNCKNERADEWCDLDNEYSSQEEAQLFVDTNETAVHFKNEGTVLFRIVPV
jgi:hypothetical protein